MKTRMIGGWGMALVVMGLSLAAARMRGDDVPDTAAPIASDTITSGPVDVAPAFPTTPPPAVAEVQLTSGAGEIAKLAQAGLGDPVMLAYIGNARSKFNLGSDQIVYLNDLGVSSDVVKAMIERDASLEAASRAAVVSNTTPPPTLDPAVTYPPAVDNSDTAAPPVDLSNYAAGTDADYFYNSLQPYGSWTYVGGYGLCWQPTVCINNHDWRPYADRGRWLDSDCGWYWQSDYSWGWATFHYGRWFNVANRGWVWAPDRTWGPAWVSWRHSADYCGWAPLPPSARFVPGAGLVYGGIGVGLNFEFGLSASLFTFIPLGRLSDYSPARYAVPSWKSSEVFSETHVANHFATVNGHAVNHSIDAREVSRLAGTEIHHVEVRDAARNEHVSAHSEQLAKHDGSMVIYRSPLPTPSAARVSVPSRVQPNQNSTPTRNYNPPHTSVEPARQTPSIYYSGSSPVPRQQSYPANSLVVIGSHNNSVASRQSTSSGSYRVFDSAASTPNHEVRSIPQNQTAYVQPVHPTAESHVYGEYVHSDSTDRSTHAYRNESHSDFSGYSGSQSHSEHHENVISAPAQQHSYSVPTSYSHSSAASTPTPASAASSSSSSSSNGKK